MELMMETTKRGSIRRVWSRSLLPSLASNAVQVVVATLHIASTNKSQSDENDDDDDDRSIQIGQQVQAHIPDLVLNNLNDLSIPSVHTYENATLLFLDVSGFTSLTEQYSNAAHLGIDQLTHTLNGYFHKLVSQILIYSGDIYKFAGDAILAVWHNRYKGPEQALACALKLQEHFGDYQTDVGVVLHLKIALAHGLVRVLFVGTEEFNHYILTGDCVKEVNACEQICVPGDVMITKNIREKIPSIDERFEIDSKENYFVVKYRTKLDNEIDSIVEMKPMIDEENFGHGLLSDAVNSLMKSFLLRCVYQRIERQQSLDYLSELRRVTISFINLELIGQEIDEDEHCRNVQQVFVRIYELTKTMGGVLTKALFFDKGWSFLCVFGLPGYKQGDDTANALKCAQMIRSMLLEESSFIEKCSIGIATGLTYCGVVGHVARCEYTVIGRKVNMAARLMCQYPNVISCDQETCYNSRLNNRFFRILPNKILKGMHNVGIIWQYDEREAAIEEKFVDQPSEIYPMLGRRLELMIVAAQIVLLAEPKSSKTNRRCDLAAIIFEGEDKIGRTRLLHFIADALSTSTIRVLRFQCHLEQRFNEFCLFRSILRQLFKFDSNEKSSYDRQQFLLALFDPSKPEEFSLRNYLFLFNDFLDVHFHQYSNENQTKDEQNVFLTYETIIGDLILHILNRLIEPDSKILFIIDDIHFADESSLKHLLTFGIHQQCLLILSMKPPSNNNNDRPTSTILQSIRTDSRVYLRRLPALELRYLPTLGCQILGVHKIPSKLVKLLNEGCNGIPGFCEEILFDLIRKEKISIVHGNEVITTDTSLVEGDADKLIVESSTKISLFKTLFSRRKSLINRNERAFTRVCLMNEPTSSDFDADCQQNFQNYLMSRIDRLSETDSLLVKIAAVIGKTFSRAFLWHMVDPQSKKSINISSSILEMMQRNVIECAHQQQTMGKRRVIRCFCLQNPGSFPSQCRLMAFSHVSIRDGIYNSLPDTLKRQLTRSAIDYLEKQCTIVCLTCGSNRNENPFLVPKNDDSLMRLVKNKSQRTFVDIVQMAALKELDQTIKQTIRSRSISSPTKPRSSTSSDVPNEPKTAPILHRTEFPFALKRRGKFVQEERRKSFDDSRIPMKTPHTSHIDRSSLIVRSIDENFQPKANRTLSNDETRIPTKKPTNSLIDRIGRWKSRWRSFFRYAFCRFVSTDEDSSSSKQPLFNNVTSNNNERPLLKHGSHWRKVRQALFVSPHRFLRAFPIEHIQCQQNIFSVDLQSFIEIQSSNRVFQQLYEQSMKFQLFQSYVEFFNSIDRSQRNVDERIDFDCSEQDFTTFTDLRVCQCADHVLTVYIKLIEYHTNLYEIYEKNREVSREKQLDRIIYYRTEICYLLLRSNCFQRLFVEIENGRRFLQRLENDESQRFLLTKYTYNFFEAVILYRTQSMTRAKMFVDEALKELEEFLHASTSNTRPIDANEMIDSFTGNDDPSSIFADNYRLEYLLCQYYLLQFHLSPHRTDEFASKLIEFQYHRYPISFSVPCTITLVEHYFSQDDSNRSLQLIDHLIRFWWSNVSPRERLELAKLKSLCLIIELKQGALDSAILSGYFAKRFLTGYHENVFLIETCIHLTLALIGEMRTSNIELILQHLEYLSEQTMNFFAKFWYYILLIDVAIELGYQLISMNDEFLDNITRYRQKLLNVSHQRTLLLFYADCTLAQIYVRVSRLSMSKKHFHQAIHQIKYNSIYLPKTDFRFQRALLKLVEVQLIHWFYTAERDEYLGKDSFLLHTIQDQFRNGCAPWNHTRFLIYRAYYDRLINTYRRERQYSIDNDYHWQTNLQQAEIDAVKIDQHWIQRLRSAWSSRPSSNSALQQFVDDCRLFLTKNNQTKFCLYVLPVKNVN